MVEGTGGIMHKKSVVGALIGHVLERYDVALYGYFSTILAPIFFPNTGDRGIIAILSSLGAFSAGYLMRPLGGIIFGHLGDRLGRKTAFTWSILLVVIPTFTIGVLPSYQEIGILAPIILIVCRLVQGLCNGGEFSGAGIFIGEHVPENRVGFAGSFVCATGILGAAIGTFLGMIVTLPDMPEWGWRLPFIVGSLLTLISWKIRKSMIETPPFEKIYKQGATEKYPLFQVLKNWKINVFCALIIGGFGHVLLYTTTIYINVIYTTILKTPPSKIMLINTGILLWWVLLSPLMGLLADRFGIKKFMLTAALASMILAYPLFWYLNQNISLYKVVTFQILFTITAVGFVAPISSLFTSFFPIKDRYSGVAFSVTLGQAILGGTTPLIATSLVEISGDPKAPSFFVIGCGLLAVTALIKLLSPEAEVLGLQKRGSKGTIAI